MREALLAIARAAGKIICQREKMVVESKEGHANFVTTIDKGVQAFLLDALQKLYPEAVAIGEEKINEELSDQPTWVIDPVDGTTNLIHDFHFSAISIALLKNRTPIIGAVYNPYTDEFFYAEKGKGASLNGSPITVSQNRMNQALTCFGTSPYQAELAQISLEMALAFLMETADIRRCGSAALELAYLAAGRIDIFFELNLKPWDYAAGALLITEAGGTFEMPLSKTGIDFSQNTAIAATNGVCMHEVNGMFERFRGRLNNVSFGQAH